MFIILAGFALVTPFLSLLLISLYYLQYKKPIQSAVLYGFAAAATFYNYIPDSGNDSIRHMYNLQYYIGVPIWKCFDAGHYTQTYVWDLWCWIVAQFKLQYLLPSTAAFMGYTITAYLVLDYCIYVNASRKNCIVVMLLTALMTSPVGIVVGIRNANAFLICTLAMYLCEVKHKSKGMGFILMLCGVLIHHSALLVLAMWLAFPVFKKKPKICGISIAFVLLSLTAISNLALKNMSGDNWIISMIVDAFSGVSVYQVDNSYNTAVSTSMKYKIESANSLLMLVLMLLRYRLSVKKKQPCRECHDDILDGTLVKLADLFTIVTLSMMMVLTINGGRYMGIAQIMAFLSMIASYDYVSFMSYGKKVQTIFLMDFLITGTLCIGAILTVYTLVWGTASGSSIIGGLLGGIVYAIANTI